MSANDIVFDEVKYREPRKVRRPDRDPARACITCGISQPGELAIFLEHQPADAIERHALSDTSVELGGILLGWECVEEKTGEPFVWITQSLEARHYANTQASFTYTHDSWEEITRERDRLFPDLDIVGWYHTHPDFGIFLSGHDLFIHEHFFAQALQVAYVVDPIRQTRGFFQWSGRQVQPVGGFHLTSARADRLALARFVNDLENLPEAGAATGARGGLGGLSPRLEAELIAMLNRPHTQAPAGALTRNSSTATGLLGAVLGALALGAALWMAGLSRRLDEQSQTLVDLKAEAATETRDQAEAAARLAAKEEALDSLLREIRLGSGAEPVLAAYQRAISERDDARAQYAALVTDKAALNTMAGQLQGERKQMETDLARADALARRVQADSAKKLEVQAARLEEQKVMLAEQSRLMEESKTGALARKYAVAWYTAAASIGMVVLMALGLVWAVARLSPDVEARAREGG